MGTPLGFHTFATSLAFTPLERPNAGQATMNVSAIVSEYDAVAALRSTTNRFPGAPVLIARERVGRVPLRGVVVNTKVANVATETADGDARAVSAAAARAFGLDDTALLPVSTGVIGWRLPVAEMTAAVATLPGHACAPLAFARAIMTTDRYPKSVSATVGRGGPSVIGFAKGAGMIEPRMATMLAFLCTDASVEPAVLDRVLGRVVDRTFNRISVDGDQSTSDMVLAFANGASGTTVQEADLERAFAAVCERLALEIVHNGEGTRHVIEVTVHGLADSALADRIAHHIVNSPLVKTAVHGEDPNIGRILAATGDACSREDEAPVGAALDHLAIRIAGRTVYRDRAFRLDAEAEQELSIRMASARIDPGAAGGGDAVPSADTGFGGAASVVPVTIELDFGLDPGATSARVWGSDLSCDYVHENADYRT